MAAGPLLVVGRADDGDDHTQNNAHDEGQDRDLNGHAQAGQIELPACPINEGPVKIDEKVLVEGQIHMGLELRRQVGIELCPVHGHSPLSFEKSKQAANKDRPLCVGFRFGETDCGISWQPLRECTCQ